MLETTSNLFSLSVDGSDELTLRGGEPKVEQYLFLFLKFMQSVLPTIDYDFTADAQA